MKRLGIVLVGLVLGVVGLVGAGMSLDSNGAYDVEIYLREGWNIVAGTLPSDGIAADSEIQESDIRAMWYYSPMSEEYMRVHPNLELNKLQQEDDDIVFTSAMWVYVNKNGYLKYNTLEDYPALGDRQLYAGYNFVTITPDMNEKSFNDFIDCVKSRKTPFVTAELGRRSLLVPLAAEKSIEEKRPITLKELEKEE